MFSVIHIFICQAHRLHQASGHSANLTAVAVLPCPKSVLDPIRSVQYRVTSNCMNVESPYSSLLNIRLTAVPKPASAVSPVDRPPPQDSDNTHVRDVSAHTCGDFERFAKYASAAYQYLCPYPLGNVFVRSVSRARVSPTLSVTYLGCL